MNASGSFVVVWPNNGRVKMRHYRNNCAAKTATEIQEVSSVAAGVQQESDPDVAIESSGKFAVTWQAGNASTPSIKLRRFDADSLPIDPSNLIVASGNQVSSPRIAMDSDGDLVVAYSGLGLGRTRPDVFTRLLARNGTLTPPCPSNSDPNGSSPDVAMDENGDYVVVWERDASVFFRRFQAGSCTVTDSTPADINAFTGNRDFEESAGSPTVAMELDGDYVIAAQLSYDDDGISEGARVRVFDKDGGVPISSCEDEDRRDSFGGGCEVSSVDGSFSGAYPAVAVDADGDGSVWFFV